MEAKRKSLIRNLALFALFFALALIGTYTLINWPSLVLQVRYVTGTLPESRSSTAESYLEIPKIHLRAPIILAATADKDKLQPLLLGGVVHYPGTPLPGESGNGVYIGHSSNYWWQSSDYNSVFALLDKLQAGDEITIHAGQNTYHYRVTEQKTVGKNAAEIFQAMSDDRAVITLVTCWPNGTDLKRFFVRAILQ